MVVGTSTAILPLHYISAHVEVGIGTGVTRTAACHASNIDRRLVTRVEAIARRRRISISVGEWMKPNRGAQPIPCTLGGIGVEAEVVRAPCDISA